MALAVVVAAAVVRGHDGVALNRDGKNEIMAMVEG